MVGLRGVLAREAPQHVPGQQLLDRFVVCQSHRSSSVQHPAELAHGRERPGLHGPERDPELLGDHDLGVAPRSTPSRAPVAAPREGSSSASRTSLRRTPRESSSTTSSARSSPVTGSRFAARSARLRRRSSRRTVSTARWCTNERKNVRNGASSGVVGLGGSPQGHERVVDDVLRQDLLAGEPVGQPVGGRASSVGTARRTLLDRLRRGVDGAPGRPGRWRARASSCITRPEWPVGG